MTNFTRLALVLPLLTAFTAVSFSAAQADNKKKPTSTTQSKGTTNGKGTGGDSKGGGQSGSPADTVNNAVGGAVNNAIGGLLGTFGPK